MSQNYENNRDKTAVLARVVLNSMRRSSPGTPESPRPHDEAERQGDLGASMFHNRNRHFT